MPEFEIVNVVGTVTFQQELDLSALAETFEQRPEINSVTYEPTENHWLQTRFEPNDTYVSFYRSGKCSIVGAKSPEHFEEIVKQVNGVMRELLDYGYDPNTEMKNIVATFQLDAVPTLEAIAIGLGIEKTEYEPEQFPGLIYRGSESVTLIFSSGKVVCTGLTDLDKISSVGDNIAERIEEFAVQ